MTFIEREEEQIPVAAACRLRVAKQLVFRTKLRHGADRFGLEM